MCYLAPPHSGCACGPSHKADPKELGHTSVCLSYVYTRTVYLELNACPGVSCRDLDLQSLMVKGRIRPRPYPITESVQNSHRSLAPIMTVMTFQSWRKLTLYIRREENAHHSSRKSSQPLVTSLST